MMDDSIASLSAGDDVKPYKIRVSSKYLDLTKKKLELTRLPHEILLPTARQWENGTPKHFIEPLIDYWLEHYEWRAQENHFNTTLPQFRVPLTAPSCPAPLRIHFVDIKSPHLNAIPLLLLPSFPLTNLSLAPLFKPLTDPENPRTTQPYHVIAPSIPGLGFSDAFTASSQLTSLLEDTAHIFNSLMIKLGYEVYIVSASGSGVTSPANIDYHLPRLLALNYPNSCLGIHLIDPPSQAPTLSAAPLYWMKFTIAKFFHASIFGYTASDWAMPTTSLARRPPLHRQQHSQDLGVEAEPAPLTNSPRDYKGRPSHGFGTTSLLGFRSPNTLAYALCDSPTGILSLVLHALHVLSPDNTFSHTEIIDMTQLAWLPGPEAAMRYWSAAEESLELSKNSRIPWSKTLTAVSVFNHGLGLRGRGCPQWANASHEVVWTKRHDGRGGLVAWERTECVLEGIRALSEKVGKIDGRLGVLQLEEVVVDTGNEVILEENDEADEETGMQLEIESPDTVVPARTPRI